MAAAVNTSTRKSQTAINEVAATVPMTVGRFMMTWLAAADSTLQRWLSRDLSLSDERDHHCGTAKAQNEL